MAGLSQSYSAESVGLLEDLNLNYFRDAVLDMFLGRERTKLKDTI